VDEPRWEAVRGWRALRDSPCETGRERWGVWGVHSNALGVFLRIFI
jgi:hypothetical protein